MQLERNPAALETSARERTLRVFLWVSVIAWGFLLGAKVFDLRVLVGAWSANPPDSLDLLPYGARYPVDTGEFFIPSSAALLVATWGATICGWKKPNLYRLLLLTSAVMIFLTLVLTVSAFWPRNAALWAAAQGAPGALTDPEAIRKMVREWVALDWVQIVLAIVGYAAALVTFGRSVPLSVVRGRASVGERTIYVVGIGLIVAFIVYFVRGVL